MYVKLFKMKDKYKSRDDLYEKHSSDYWEQCSEQGELSDHTAMWRTLASYPG